MADSFWALVLEEAEKGVTASIQTIDEDRLPDGDVTVAVSYSTLNYKDGMVLGGIGRLVRDYPHVPGIDFAGTVTSSDSPDYGAGDKVVLTGWRVGEAQWGGYAERARVKADWLVPLPDGLSEKDAMTLGTAGFTAMLAVMELEDHGITPESGPVLVTGANGGVGGVAVAVLARLGYEVHAATGRVELADDRPVLLRFEDFDFRFALADQSQSDRLHPSRRARARQFPPEHRRQRETD